MLEKPAGEITVRGWLWSNGAYTLFDPLPRYRSCRPHDINDDGIIVGRSDDAIDPGNPNNPAPAFIWKDGVMTSLSTLLPPNSGIRVTSALGINNVGQVVVNGSIQGMSGGHGFRLTPIPPVIGDVNCDQSVNVLDLLAVINQWGPGGRGQRAR